MHSLLSAVGVIGSEEFAEASDNLTIFKSFETMNNSPLVFHVMKWKRIPLRFLSFKNTNNSVC